MKKSTYLLLIFLFAFTSNSFSQKNYNIGLSIGGSNYFGDLGNEDFLQYTSTRPGATITFRNFINNPSKSGKRVTALDLETRLSWHRIGYDETEPIGNNSGFELRNYGRGLSFRSDVFGLSSNITYSFYQNKAEPIHKQRAVFYVFTGVGVFHSNPKADLFKGDVDINNRYFFWSDGTVRDADEQTANGNVIEKDGEYETTLADWKTENKNYSNYSIAIPYGIGLRWGISKRVTLGAEFSYYYYFFDYLDDVSDAYALNSEINNNFPNDPAKQQLAAYITDPTGLGSSGIDNVATSPRGNPDYNDAYSFLSFEVSYNFKKIFKKE
jgi:hypothetical protein